MEELCASAVKEEQIEVKLAAVGAQWAAEAFTFAEHKQRGAVVLKVGPRAGGWCVSEDQWSRVCWVCAGCVLVCGGTCSILRYRPVPVSLPTVTPIHTSPVWGHTPTYPLI